ncbi:MAG: hypothetical protein ACTSW1_00600 [Candidatus Hodarchaeales archaeon]
MNQQVKLEEDLLEQGYRLIAPHILEPVEEMALVKKFIFLQMFTNPKIERFNILLIGSAATGKSDLGLDVAKLHPNAVFVSKNTTEAGLTGVATRHGIIGGVLIQAREGLVIADDFDKVSKSVRDSLLEVLQSGVLTTTKWGQQHKIPINANFLVIANPTGGRWIGPPNLGQIKFDAPFISRFHAVIPFVDLSAEDYEKLSSSFDIKERLRQEDDRRIRKLNAFISKIKEIETISINYDIISRITKFTGELKDKYEFLAPTITPRQVEGIISLVKAHARMNLRDHCKAKDFDVIKKLFKQLFNMWMGGFH